jgi:hypothetical protein
MEAEMKLSLLLLTAFALVTLTSAILCRAARPYSRGPAVRQANAGDVIRSSAQPRHWREMFLHR